MTKCKHCGHDPNAVRCHFCPDEPLLSDRVCSYPSENGYACTRETGHELPHVACGADTGFEDFPGSHMFAIWED